MNQLLAQYSYLQVLDFLTTIAFLLNGVREGNPLVRLAMQVAPNPMVGLLLVKLAAVMLVTSRNKSSMLISSRMIWASCARLSRGPPAA